MQLSTTPNTIDLSTSRHIHVVAIGGTGMSAIAGVLLAMGHEVSGSDAGDSLYLQRVRESGADAWVGHDAGRMSESIDAVVASTAVPSTNVEVEEARRRGIPVLRRADILASIAATRHTIAVAGTHGKTTTSTLLALALEAGGARPSWIIGAEIAGRGNGCHWDAGQHMVVEADESDGTFLQLSARSVVVTNVEPDHLETYGGWPQLQQAFADFVENATESRVICIDDEGGRSLSERFDCASYGTSSDAKYRIDNCLLDRFSSTFDIVAPDGDVVTVSLPLPGLHNVRNATGALVAAELAGVPLSTGAQGLTLYKGIGRRFQQRGEIDGITFVDDYAHLPTEVSAALEAARAGQWKRVVAVFQPHRYSRTQQVGADFGKAFDAADQLVLADVYAAGEQPRENVDGTILVRAVEANPTHPLFEYCADRSALAAHVSALLEPGDLCITLGAGDVTKLADEIIELRRR